MCLGPTVVVVDVDLHMLTGLGVELGAAGGSRAFQKTITPS